MKKKYSYPFLLISKLTGMEEISRLVDGSYGGDIGDGDGDDFGELQGL